MAIYQIFNYKNLNAQNNKLIQLLTDRSSFIPNILSSNPNNSSVSLSWSVPHSESINSYKIKVYSSDGILLNTVSNIQSTSYNITGLTNGNTYKFRISSILKNKKEILSSEEISTPFNPTAPSAPSITSATSGNNSVSLVWSAPISDGGSPITSYKVYVYSNNVLLYTFTNIQTTSYNVTGLTNGTSYEFKVSAVNEIGDSSLSTALSSIPDVTVPSAPVITEIILGQNMNDTTNATVKWSVPENGGSPITSYKVYITEGYYSFYGIASNPEYLLQVLDPNITTTVKVSAVNAIGESPLSTEINFLDNNLTKDFGFK